MLPLRSLFIAACMTILSIQCYAQVPELPKPKRSTKPFQSELITQWGENVTAENAWTEYPRLQMQRDNWMNLNGHWDYSITPIAQTESPADWKGKIIVPYCSTKCHEILDKHARISIVFNRCTIFTGVARTLHVVSVLKFAL